MAALRVGRHVDLPQCDCIVRQTLCFEGADIRFPIVPFLYPEDFVLDIDLAPAPPIDTHFRFLALEARIEAPLTSSFAEITFSSITDFSEAQALVPAIRTMLPIARSLVPRQRFHSEQITRTLWNLPVPAASSTAARTRGVRMDFSPNVLWNVDANERIYLGINYYARGELVALADAVVRDQEVLLAPELPAPGSRPNFDSLLRTPILGVLTSRLYDDPFMLPLTRVPKQYVTLFYHLAFVDA